MVEISKDKDRLDIPAIHAFLTDSYWAKGRTIKEVKNTIVNSLCFGVYVDAVQVGFARVCTDYTVFAYLMDVFILPQYRGKGYSKTLMKEIVNDPQLQNCHTWMLKTADAHGLYKQFNFEELHNANLVMERLLK